MPDRSTSSVHDDRNLVVLGQVFAPTESGDRVSLPAHFPRCQEAAGNEAWSQAAASSGRLGIHVGKLNLTITIMLLDSGSR